MYRGQPFPDTDRQVAKELRRLEERLLDAGARKDQAFLDQCLSGSFLEIGVSGRKFSKQDIIRDLSGEPDSLRRSLSEFRARQISSSIYMTNWIGILSEDGRIFRRSHRTSIWKSDDDGYRLVFHQGTGIKG